MSTADELLNLDRIRATLTRLEDTIIFSLIERAQFAHNPRIYKKGGFEELVKDGGFKSSWVEWFLKEVEHSHAKVRRYESPDEFPFTPRSQLPKPLLPPLSISPVLHPHDINVNPQIFDFYVSHIVPAITKRATSLLPDGKEDDANMYGSAATRDVEALQAMSKRIHYGLFVAESKFRSSPGSFIPHIQNPNPSALEALITKPEVEARLLVRLERKALMYGRETDANGVPIVIDGETKEGEAGYVTKIEAEDAVRLYRDYIIPLTRDVEVMYLLKRLDGLSEQDIQKLSLQK